MRNTGECLILSHLSSQAMRSGDETSGNQRRRAIVDLSLPSFLYLLLPLFLLLFSSLLLLLPCPRSAGAMILLHPLAVEHIPAVDISGPNPSYSRGFEETLEQV